MPLNIVVVLFLLLVGSVPREALIIGCALLCGGAALCQRGLARILAAEAFARQAEDQASASTDSLAVQLEKSGKGQAASKGPSSEAPDAAGMA